jgi:hypothetical protein
VEVSQIMSDAQKKDLETLLEEVLKSTNADKNYGAIKAGIGLIPGAGGAIAEFYSTYISPPAQKRLYLFLESLIKDLRKLEVQVRDFSLASLKENPCFTTMLIQSFDIAKRNHQEEKLEALRNLLLNSALPNSIEDDMKLLFLDWVDELKISHINLLYMSRPRLNCISGKTEYFTTANLPPEPEYVRRNPIAYTFQSHLD